MTLHSELIHDYKYQLSSLLKPSFHTHSKYEIYYFHSGKCNYVIGGHTIELVPGDLIIMNGLRQHGPIIDERYNYIRTTVLFDGTLLGPLLSHQPGSIDVLAPFEQSGYVHWRLDEELKQEVEPILAKMNRYYEKPDLLAYNRLRNAFMELLLFIYERFQHTTTVRPSHAASTERENIVKQALAYIEQHYTTDFSMSDLAKHLFVSRYHLMKLFKEHTAATVFEYTNKRRIDQAKILFYLDKEQTVTEISYQVGFKQPSHFSRNFKKIVGMTPEQYRRLMAK